MTESKWAEPGAITAAIIALIAVGGIVWSAATIAAASTNLASNFDQFKHDVSGQISGVQTQIITVQNQIASLPTQGFRLDAVESGLKEMRQDNATQGADINALKQGVAVLRSAMDAMRHDIDALQNAANGRLPGARR